MSALTADPRIGLGYDVESNVQAPFAIMPAKSDGSGTLDVGIIAHTSGGVRIVIGEIWAACPNDEDGKTRIDAHRVATEIVAKLNEAAGVTP